MGTGTWGHALARGGMLARGHGDKGRGTVLGGGWRDLNLTLVPNTRTWDLAAETWDLRMD